MRIAVIGTGISGLAAALRLSAVHEVVVYDKSSRPGGHTHTVDVALDGFEYPVDTGFLVFNRRTYPKLIALFSELGIPTAPSDMSFSVSVGPYRREWCGASLGTLFAQPSNAFRPAFWRMIRDIVRFNREATALALDSGSTQAALRLDEPLMSFLERSGYSQSFRDEYLLPMAAAIWSCPMRTMQRFPLGTFVRFFHNHGLLTIGERPQWMTVPGGARQYVDAILAQLPDVRLGLPVEAVKLSPGGPGRLAVHSADRVEHFDHVVLACHSDESLALLPDADPEQRAILESVRYQPNRAWLHTDSALMPMRRKAWAAWNYLSNGDPDAPEVSVTYWLNRLQPLPFKTPVLISLNPIVEPSAEHVLQVIDYAHPVFDSAAGRAQRRLPAVQGRHGLWLAGAWTGYGFHEDGLDSGLSVAGAINALASSLRAAA
jgi:predicted NAD/FAD-binding protein